MQKKSIETIIYLLTGIMFIVFGFLLHNRDFVHLIDLNVVTHRTSQVITMLWIYGGLLFVFAAYSILLARKGKSLTKNFIQLLTDSVNQINSFLRNTFSRKPDLFNIIWLILVLVAGAFIRLFFANDTIRLDESSTIVNAVIGPFYKTVVYFSTNNHLLHTQFVQLTTKLFGLSPFSVRIPALTAGILTLPLVYIATRRIIGSTNGLFATIMLVVLPFMIMYDTVARGYSLNNFFFVIGIIIGNSIGNRITVPKVFLFALCLSMGAFVITSFLYAAAGLLLWVFVLLIYQKNSFSDIIKKYVIPTSVAFILITFILYTTKFIYSNINKIISNKYIVALPFNEFSAQIGPHFQGVFQSVFRDVPDYLFYTLLIITILGFALMIRNKQYKILLFAGSILFGVFVLFMIKRAIPFSRTWTFLVPVIAIMADAGLSSITRLFNSTIQNVIKAILITGMFYCVYSISSNKLITSYGDIGTFKEAEQVAKFLEDKFYNGDKLTGLPVVINPTKFYWAMNDFDPALTEHKHKPAKTFYIIMKNRTQISDYTDKNLQPVFEYGHAKVYVEE